MATLAEHNREYGTSIQPADHVMGYCPQTPLLEEYDQGCARCWLGYGHTWAHHDVSVLYHRYVGSRTQGNPATEEQLRELATARAEERRVDPYVTERARL